MSISGLKLLPRSTLLKNALLKPTCSLLNRNYATLRRAQPGIATITTEKDDHIRLIFDDTAAWKHQSKIVRSASQNSGLFENPHFNSVYGIDYAAQQAIQQAQIIVERICNAPKNGHEEMTRIVKNLDRLSDTLCSVIDIAEFVRNAHPDPVIMEAANKAYGDLCSYMNTLNTDIRIHQVRIKQHYGFIRKLTCLLFVGFVFGA
jgi:intermediate peptidase